MKQVSPAPDAISKILLGFGETSVSPSPSASKPADVPNFQTEPANTPVEGAATPERCCVMKCAPVCLGFSSEPLARLKEHM